MKNTKVIFLSSIFILGCSTNTQTNNSIPIITPTPPIPSVNNSDVKIIEKASYNIDKNFQKTFNDLKNLLNDIKVTSNYIDDKGNSIFVTLDHNFYNIFFFKELNQVSTSIKNTRPFDLASSNFCLNDDGDGLYFARLIKPFSEIISYEPKPILIKFKNYKPLDNQIYELNYPVDKLFFQEPESGNGFYLNFVDDKIKFYDVSNFTDSKFIKEVKFLDQNTELVSYILNQDGNGIILVKNILTNEFSTFRLENKNIELIERYKNNNFSQISGNLDLEGNGYLYSQVKDLSKIYQFKVEKYHFNPKNPKVLNLKINKTNNYPFLKDIFINDIGTGFITYSIGNEISYSKIDNFIINDEIITVTNGEQIRFNYKISVNKFGDGFISWNEDIGFTNRSIIILIHNYQLIF